MNRVSRIQARNESLDWLRGLLAVSIMLYHLVSWEVGQLDASSLLGRLGAYGVSMFFILSGLSIALVYHRFIVDGSTVVRFYVRRIFRIWPLMWLAVIVVTGARALQGEVLSWKLVLLNLTTLFGFVRPTAYINTGAWSIGNEMVYYALTPAIIAIYNRSKQAGNLLTAATVAVGLVFSQSLLNAQVPLAEQWGTYVNPFNNLFLYCSGVALYYNADHLRPTRMFCLAVLAVSVLIFLWHPVEGNQIVIVTGWSRIAFCAASIGIVFAFYKNGMSLGRPVALALTQLGLATYSVYLLHPILWWASSELVKRHHVQAAPAVVICLSIAGTLVVAWSCYHYYELPFMRLGKRLTSQPLAPEPVSSQQSRPNQSGLNDTTSSW